jgi:hypothetical protein
MGNMRITVLMGIALLIIVLLASCGGGGHRALPTIDKPPTDNNQQQAGGNLTEPPDYYTSAPTAEISQESVLVHTGRTAAEFAPIAEKYGYEVLGSIGAHYLNVRVPDRDVSAAVDNLSKEYSVLSVETQHNYIMPRERAQNHGDVKSASYMPFDSLYADRFLFPTDYDTANSQVLYSTYWGQRVYMAPMGFEGAWDTAIRTGVASTPVTIAVIDAGIWHDAVNNPNGHPDFDYDPANPTLDRVADGSGYVDAAGVFTPDAFWYDVDGNGDAYRTTGHRLVSMFASGWNNGIVYTTQVGDPPVDATVNASMSPLTPAADVMIVKTGVVGGTNWSFTDAHIAASINHAVAQGANIILLGMWAEGAVAPAVQTAIDAARTADVLVISPAGMSQLDTTDADPANWTWGTPGPVSAVTPASANGVLSVSGTGFEPIDQDQAPPIDGYYNGYANTILANIGDAWNETASYSYTGGDMAAVGWAVTWAGNFFNMGINVNTSVNAAGNVDIAYAAAYVAAAASICYQGLTNANGGTAPADVDQTIEDILIQESLLLPGGEHFLAAGAAASIANNGGWDQVINSLDITNYGMSGAVFNGAGNAFLEVGQATDLTASMVSNGGNYEIVIAWGDGTTYPADYATSGNYVAYTPNDPITHTYAVAGDYRCTILGHETVNDTYDEVSFAVFVYNSLNANLQVKNAQGGVVTTLPIAETFQMSSNADYNAITGNVVTFDWDFNWDEVNANFAADVSNTENPLFSYDTPPGGYSGPVHYLDLGPGTYTIGLRVTQTRRPTLYFTLDVTVS